MIKFVVFDFDGVFTDNKVYFENNNIKKYYNIKDGKGLSLLRNKNIKTGLLSNFSTDKSLYLNEKKVIDNLINHLKFDYHYIGSKNKMEIIESWIKMENISFEEIAYIGDDLNDIEILKQVNFSGCPQDSIDEVKNKVDYICEKKGGYGCVREFIEKILEPKKDLISEIRKEVNYQLDNFNMEKINKLVELIKNSKKNIYFMGVGKSGNIAKHCCDLLKCISINTFYLDCLNMTHGDIGVVKDNMVIMFSKSGNTKELINLINLLKKRNCYLVGICCDKKSIFSKNCDFVIETPFNQEINGEINKIPTNSYVSHLLFSNILVSKLKNNISLDEYKENHKSGNIGKNLMKIKDCMTEEFPKILLTNKISLHEVLLKMTKYGVGISLFTNKNNELLGILTDGDIRRLLLKNENKIYIDLSDINKEYYYETNIEKYLFKCKKISYIPIINNDKIFLLKI